MDERQVTNSSARQLADLLAVAFQEPAPGSPGSPGSSPVSLQTCGALGEYQLLEKLGEGGMGTVYKARHTELDRLVAIKVMRPGHLTEAEAAARFRREIKLTARLDHPHLVRALDARTVGNTHFLVTEYVDGLDLQTLSDRLGPLPVADACELVRQAASGLQYAHEHGLVHRDIKPSNLMLAVTGASPPSETRSPKSAVVKVLDLGLARVVGAVSTSQQVTTIGQVMGTPDYIAPEQIGDSSGADIRADIYSLGCTLYLLLAGRPPFSGFQYRDVWEKMQAHLHKTVPPIRDARQDVPKGLARVLDQMLAKDRADRYATPGEVAEALSRFTGGTDLAGCLALAADRSSSAARARAADTCAVHAEDAARDQARTAQTPGWRHRPAVTRWRWPLAAVAILLVAAGVATVLWSNRSRQETSGRNAAVEPSTDQTSAGASKTQPQPPTTSKPPSGLPKAGAEPTPTAIPTPTQEPLTGWIVLSWTRPGLGRPDLWMFQPDGHVRVNITNEPRYFEIQPQFSPDGRHIAFIRGTEPTAPTTVWVCRSDGRDARPLAVPQSETERFGSPVWLSDSSVCYVRDPIRNRIPDVELWQVDLSGSPPRRMFRFADVFKEGNGVITDVSPDGRQLAAIVQNQALSSTADVFVCDPQGGAVRKIWSDPHDDHKDSRALWSPDGRRIAWHHNLTAGSSSDPLRFGVGLARPGSNGEWTAELQPPDDPWVAPLAWSPRGDWLLCARIHSPELRASSATLFCLDDRFQTAQVLFELEPSFWVAAHRDLARLADWALVPDDAAPSRPGK